MQNIVLDFCMAMTPEGIQEYLASVFHFPDYYGKNLDAFYDMLTGRPVSRCWNPHCRHRMRAPPNTSAV